METLAWLVEKYENDDWVPKYYILRPYKIIKKKWLFFFHYDQIIFDKKESYETEAISLASGKSRVRELVGMIEWSDNWGGQPAYPKTIWSSES